MCVENFKFRAVQIAPQDTLRGKPHEIYIYIMI